MCSGPNAPGIAANAVQEMDVRYTSVSASKGSDSKGRAQIRLTSKRSEVFCPSQETQSPAHSHPRARQLARLSPVTLEWRD